MHFCTLALAALLSFTSAIPTAAVEKRWPSTTNIIKPYTISIYHSFNGAITPAVDKGEVSRNYWDGRDNTTLVTFDITGRTLPATCFLRFYLDPADSAASWSGTAQIDVFSSLQPAPAQGSAGWGGPGNQRNLPLGRFQVTGLGQATPLNFAPNQLGSFPCPKVGDGNVRDGKVGYELVPVGDQDRVTWSADLSGLYLGW